MNVIIKCKRQLIIDNDINILDIKTTGGNVSGDHDVACWHFLSILLNREFLGWDLESVVDLVSRLLGIASMDTPSLAIYGGIQFSIIQHKSFKFVNVHFVEAED